MMRLLRLVGVALVALLTVGCSSGQLTDFVNNVSGEISASEELNSDPSRWECPAGETSYSDFFQFTSTPYDSSLFEGKISGGGFNGTGDVGFRNCATYPATDEQPCVNYITIDARVDGKKFDGFYHLDEMLICSGGGFEASALTEDDYVIDISGHFVFADEKPTKLEVIVATSASADVSDESDLPRTW